MKQKKLQRNRTRRANRVHFKIKAKSDNKARVVVFRSLNHMYAQLIDDQAGKTIASASTLMLKEKKSSKVESAKFVGIELATRAKKAGVEEACFDRGRFLYHGRVKSVVEGLREGGLKI